MHRINRFRFLKPAFAFGVYLTLVSISLFPITAFAGSPACGFSYGFEAGAPNSQPRAKLGGAALVHELTGEDEGVGFLTAAALKCHNLGRLQIGYGIGIAQSTRFDYGVYVDSSKRRLPAEQYLEEIQANLYASISEFLISPKLEIGTNLTFEPSIGMGLTLNSTDARHFYDPCMYDKVPCQPNKSRTQTWAHKLQPAYSLGVGLSYKLAPGANLALGYKFRDLSAYEAASFSLGGDSSACKDSACGTVSLNGYHKAHLLSVNARFEF